MARFEEKLVAESRRVISMGPALSVPEVSADQRVISLAACAYLQIRNKILKGELPVGLALSRRHLAAELNISVPPVTEALQQLEAEGLLESKPRVGTRVRIPTRQDIVDRSIVREALEIQAARLFVEQATPAEKQELRQMGRQMDQLYACCEAETVDRDFLFSANIYHMQLHLRIAECARCPALRDAIEKEQVLVFSWIYDMSARRRTLGADFHTRLTEVLATGTPAEADAAIRHHIHFGLREVLGKFDLVRDTGQSWRPKKRLPMRKAS